MSECRVCRNPVPRHQTFCSECGARQVVDTRRERAKRSLFAGVKSFFGELFRTEGEKEAERHLQAGFNLGRYSFEAAIPDHEEAVRLDPSPENKSILAITYLGAGDERLGLIGFGGPIYQLTFGSWTSGQVKAEKILSWVSKVRQLEGKEFFRYSEAYHGLNKALNEALEMYDNACRVDPTHPRVYQGRARAFHRIADALLWAHGIDGHSHFIRCRDYEYVSKIEERLKRYGGFTSEGDSQVKDEGKLIRYGNANLGVCLIREAPELKFVDEIIWLYEQAEEDYLAALRRDTTSTESYVGLAHVLWHLGKTDETTNNLNKAVTILNKAIQADNRDEQSYSERAEIFEELGEIESAILDLERALTLSTWHVDTIRWKIETLRKRKAQTRK